MLCSKCGNEMEKGYMPVHTGRLYWIPEHAKVSWNVAKIPKESIALSEYTITTPRKSEAYYCKHCEIVIIPVNNELK